jgi:hypothetical protein
LENVVFGGIENLRIVTTIVLDHADNLVDNCVWKNHLSLGAGQQVGVENADRAVTDVGAGDLLSGRNVVASISHPPWEDSRARTCVGIAGIRVARSEAAATFRSEKG